MENFSLLVTHAKNEYPRFWEYHSRADDQLMNFYAQCLAWARQGVARILDTKGAAPFLKTTAKLITDIANTPDVDHLRYLYAIHPDVRPLKALVWLDMECKNLKEELFCRCKHFEAGMALLAQEEGAWQPESVEDYNRLVKIDQLTSRVPLKEEDQDARALALAGMWEFFQNRHKTIKPMDSSDVQFSPLPLEWGFPVRQLPQWDTWTVENARISLEELRQYFLSLFRGGFDRAKEAAWQALRDNSEKWEAQKRSSNVELLDLDSVRTVGIDESRRVDATIDAGVALKRAVELYGESGRQFVQGMLDSNGNKSEASELAGISRVTANKRINELQLHLVKEKK